MHEYKLKRHGGSKGSGPDLIKTFSLGTSEPLGVQTEPNRLRYIKRSNKLILQERIKDSSGMEHWQDIPIEEEF
jgi:hypothetical protein